MKFRSWITCVVGVAPMFGCAAMAPESVAPLAESCRRPEVIGFAMASEREVVAALGTSATREVVLMLNEAAAPARQEEIAGILLDVRKEEREIMERILVEEQGLRNQADGSGPEAVAERYGQISELRSQMIRANARAILDLNEGRQAPDTSAGSGSAQPRMMGGLPMMNVRWCIDFCAGQADVLCNGGADLACWRKRFLRCAQLCY